MKLGWAHNREFAITPTINWAKLNKIGILERLNPYLTNSFEENGVTITCNGWRNLFSVKELVYKELCVELFSTVSNYSGSTFYGYNSVQTWWSLS